MSIKSYYNRVKTSVGAWYYGGGLPILKRLASGLYGQIFQRYGPQILSTVLSIATGELRPAQGQDKADLFRERLKAIIDTDGDGAIHFSDIPKNTQDLLGKTGLELLRSFGSTENEQIDGLREYLKGLV